MALQPRRQVSPARAEAGDIAFAVGLRVETYRVRRGGAVDGEGVGLVVLGHVPHVGCEGRIGCRALVRREDDWVVNLGGWGSGGVGVRSFILDFLADGDDDGAVARS